MKPVRFHDAARAELIAEAHYYATISPLLAERFVNAVERATQLAARFPEMGAPYKFGTRCVFLGRFPFSLVYLNRPTEVHVIALAPFSRKSGYWRAPARDA